MIMYHRPVGSVGGAQDFRIVQTQDLLKHGLSGYIYKRLDLLVFSEK